VIKILAALVFALGLPTAFLVDNEETAAQIVQALIDAVQAVESENQNGN
jgi:hypothetical protein